jgi:ComF family protein
VLSCRRPLDAAEGEWSAELPLFSWGRYQESLKRSIAALKYHNQTQLAIPLGRWMAEVWHQTRNDRPPQPARLTVIPIPLHDRKLKQRGFNQAALLAHSFCRYARLPLLDHGLVRVKATEAQFGLSKNDRSLNLTDAFQLGKPLKILTRSKPSILLLDDIFTTGATARSAAQILKQADISVYGMVVLARAGQ